MIFEFVENFKRIFVGQKIRIKDRFIPPCFYKIVPVTSVFSKYINEYENCFTIRTIQVVDDDNAMICVDEVQGILEYNQVERYSKIRRIINSYGE